MGMARDYVIYSISQDISMGFENEDIKKNFYVDIGESQGVEEGSVLNVYRNISRQDSYETKKRYSHQVKIGELEVLHTEENSSIGLLKELRLGKKDPYFEISNFMIGDKVEVKID